MIPVYKYYIDPGHGWLCVTMQDLKDLGIEKKISKYSYRTGIAVFLEEDVDMPLFVAAYKNRMGGRPTITEMYSSEESFIRELGRYAPDGDVEVDSNGDIIRHHMLTECPSCDCSSFTPTFDEFFNDEYIVTMTCDGCKLKWEYVYVFHTTIQRKGE